MNYFPFHIGDYMSATRHLSWEEDCAYRRLLDVYYTSEKPLPIDPRNVCRLILATTDSQREAVSVVLEEFFEATEAGWIHHRADAEIEVMRDKQQKQRDKANKRWHKPAEEPGIAQALPQQQEEHATASNINADAMPPTPTPTPTPTPKGKEKGADALTVQALVLDGLTEQTAVEFLTLRRSKGAKLTPRAWQGIRTQADKAGWQIEDAVCKSLSRGWVSFEAAWVVAEQRAGPVSKQAALEARNRAVIDDFMRERAHEPQ